MAESSSDWSKKVDRKSFTYPTLIGEIKILKAEIDEETGEVIKPKRVSISGRLMDDSINKNFWRVKSEYHSKLAGEVTGVAVKVQHSESDWEIIGTGIIGSSQGNLITYNSEVTDTDAVNKFETKTWNAQNMGISPSVTYDRVECSICGKEPEMSMFGPIHEHQRGKKYKGQVAFLEIINPKLDEMSVTSRPAYAPNAGTIDVVSFSASLEKNFKKTEVKSMTEKDISKDYEIILAEKENKITEIKDQLEAKNKEFKELQASIETSEAKSKEVVEKLEATEKVLESHVRTVRAQTLTELNLPKELVSEVLEKKMTAEEFDAEVKRFKMIQEASVKNDSQSTVGNGTVPGDAPSANQEKQRALVGESLFGSNWKQYIGEGGESA